MLTFVYIGDINMNSENKKNNNVLVIAGHPAKDSLCINLAKAYVQSATGAGHNVEFINLADLNFNPNLQSGFAKDAPLEVDLQKAQESIRKASHLVFVYPNWWGTMPALLKAFIDRVFLPGFAFQYIPGAMMPKKLLTGKSAHLIVTMDTPPWIYRYLLGNPGGKVMSKLILGFCGIDVSQTLYLGPVRNSEEKTRKDWIEKVTLLAKKIQ